jgi:hypothetical protein
MSKVKLNFVEESKAQKDLPTLFVLDTKGKLRMWKCWVIDDTVYREYGLVEGKKIKSERKFESKNIGKQNEKTAFEQALNEANKEWIARIDKKYAPDADS